MVTGLDFLVRGDWERILSSRALRPIICKHFRLSLKAPDVGGNHCEDAVDIGLLLERLCDSARNLVVKYEAVPSIGNCIDNKNANGLWCSFRSDEYSRFAVSTCSERKDKFCHCSINIIW